uniref:Uncharacterized protein n=1 Tax=Nelumbo nucifera TaxID=4432 RepID=A0A822XX59_NELNU|nr:TPA_asm: hypothetical protein HUJ06_025214 [Nelumbo nucifera]
MGGIIDLNTITDDDDDASAVVECRLASLLSSSPSASPHIHFTVLVIFVCVSFGFPSVRFTVLVVFVVVGGECRPASLLSPSASASPTSTSLCSSSSYASASASPASASLCSWSSLLSTVGGAVCLELWHVCRKKGSL